jgi:NAD(P)-dependent dehydrogenase (short-subunit alcohol dehydrogenase family)
MSGAKRVVVVGASTGLGRCLGIGLAQRGAEVALLARSEARLVDAAKEAGAGALAIRCDVTDEMSCHTAIEEAAKGLGGIDVVLYSAAIGELRRIEELDAATWQRAFATNVIGASLVTAAALPHLAASAGMVAFFTSVSASLTSPWPGLASYTVSKAALDKLVEAWRSEHPEVGFTQLIIGECQGGEGDAFSHFTTSWDADLAGELYPTWVARGLMTDKQMDVGDFVAAVDALVRCGSTAAVPTFAITPRRPI